MWFKTPRAKVYGYRAVLGIQCGAAAMFGVLGFFRFVSPFFAEAGSVVFLLTAFASLQMEFAKEVRKIVQFKRSGHSWDQYPTTDKERDVLRRELRPQLVIAGMNMIGGFKTFKQFEKLLPETDDLQGLKAARVTYQNAKNAFYQRWRVYDSVGVLPLRAGLEPWRSPIEFLGDLQQRMRRQRQKNNLMCA
jgi:hypothetical protein